MKPAAHDAPMKPMTFAERKALADASARRHQQRAAQTVDRQRQANWAISKLTRWLASRTITPPTAR